MPTSPSLRCRATNRTPSPSRQRTITMVTPSIRFPYPKALQTVRKSPWRTRCISRWRTRWPIATPKTKVGSTKREFIKKSTVHGKRMILSLSPSSRMALASLMTKKAMPISPRNLILPLMASKSLRIWKWLSLMASYPRFPLLRTVVNTRSTESEKPMSLCLRKTSFMRRGWWARRHTKMLCFPRPSREIASTRATTLMRINIIPIPPPCPIFATGTRLNIVMNSVLTEFQTPLNISSTLWRTPFAMYTKKLTVPGKRRRTAKGTKQHLKRLKTPSFSLGIPMRALLSIKTAPLIAPHPLK